MKKYAFLLLILLATSCQITETIHLNDDGSGKIQTESHRDEYSYMQLMGENYSKEAVFRDTTYVFQNVIAKHSETFSRLPVSEQAIFKKFANVNVHIKKSSYEKEFRTIISQSFKKIEEVADLYKTEEYADDLENNYALSAEEHYYAVSYSFVNGVFKRSLKITNPVELKIQQDKIDSYKKKIAPLNLKQDYVLNYHFPRKIKSVSNPKAKISEDKKSLEVQFLIADCMQNPLITNLEVILE